MDPASLACANAVAGNPADAAAIEWALAGGTIRFTERSTIAIAGAEVELARNGAVVSRGVAMDCEPGDELAIGRFISGAYAYIAVRCGIDVPLVLGSRSTYLPAGFGGLGGRRLRAGDVLRVGTSSIARPFSRADHSIAAVYGAKTRIRAIEGPNTAAFPADFREEFWASEFTLSPSSNRAGYRLEREPHADPGGRSAISEPACVGAIQVPGGGSAIVLMPDGPTVGGYPKIGVVASVDIPVLAQSMSGATVRFERISVAEAQRLWRESALAQTGVQS